MRLMSKPFADVAEPDALTVGAALRRQSPPRVRYADHDRISATFRGKQNRSPIGGRFDPVLDRVFDQRNEQVRRERMTAQLVGNVDGERETRSDADPQDVQIRLRQRDLARECGRAGAQLG